ncbi:hypothetical protein BDY19DRAFT_543918 [Irpex rosettiformis]|uniref:Uncharacterized protein n=1 Tax=Irpex rosettiformis TaxID=378272 RepID=A0ACB8TQK3_9APHY|nr:hypothetical protein BDY19DRAFT_543918 [Irpex rosettiformis]
MIRCHSWRIFTAFLVNLTAINTYWFSCHLHCRKRYWCAYLHQALRRKGTNIAAASWSDNVQIPLTHFTPIINLTSYGSVIMHDAFLAEFR